MTPPEDVPASIQVFGIPGLPEFGPGDDIAALFLDRLESGVLGPAGLIDGDVIVVTSKIVSKVEGRTVAAEDREDAITAETVRVVASRGQTRVVQTHHGFVMAAAGVDASNTGSGTVLLLPLDPDQSARSIREALQEATDTQLAVVVTDTAGRPWRNGLVDLSLGAAGLQVLVDYRGQEDSFGNFLAQTVIAVVDEIAAAADLVKGKLSGIPIAVIRGLEHLVVVEDGPGVAALIRGSDQDLFRLGTREAIELGRSQPQG